MSWFTPSSAAPFGATELPYGVGAVPGRPAGVVVAVGDQAVQLAAVWRALGRDPTVFDQPRLNPFLAQGRQAWTETRSVLAGLLADPSGQDMLAPHLTALSDLTMRLPFDVADYVDFYASEHHATNVGRIFRPGSPPLTPNWRHMPIGYHGRAGTVVVTGTPIRRPCGQLPPAPDAPPTFGPTAKLDIEAELGWVVGVGSAPGETVPVQDFRDHVFGVVVLNDWSARDIQAWEYVPLGPFLGKSFATSISAWVLPLEALDDAQVPLPDPDRPLLPYLRGAAPGYAVDVEVWLDGTLVSTCPYAAMSYSPAQMLAHQTVNGASLRTGDLFGSGTISGPAPDQRGSLLELSWNGTEPLELGAGQRRAFLDDGDEVVLRAVSGGPSRARLGEVRGTILPAPWS